MSNFGVVSTINAPTLTSVKQQELIVFEKEYKAYEEKIADVNKSRNGENIQPTSIKNCIEPAILNGLCVLRKLGSASKAEEATDDDVNKWFKGRLKSVSRDLSERIRSAINSVTFHTDRRDPEGAALTFTMEVIEALAVNNASEAVKDQETCKNLIDKLVNKLEPPELRERLRDARECWSKEDKGSLSVFEEKVTALAVDVAQGEVARARLRRKQPFNRKDKDKCGNGDGNRKHGSEGSGKRSEPSPSYETSKNGIPPKKKKFKHKCLNPECNEFHLIKNCDKTPDKLKKDLLDKFYDDKKAAKSMKHNSNTPNISHMGDGRYKAFLEDMVEVVALGDYGSDINALPDADLQKLLEENKHLKFESISPPMHFKTALSNTPNQNIEFTASKKVELSITLLLPGSNIPVRIRGIEFAVVDQQMEEVLLGRPLLKSVGFNLDHHLNRVHAEVHNKHVKELKNQSTLAKLSYTGLSYKEEDDDPIILPDIVGAGIGLDNEEEVQHAFQKMLQEAEENGCPKQTVIKMRMLLSKYRDVFRIKLGKDAPAKIEPLLVTIKSGARPYRSPQRRYSPEQRAFLTQTIRELEDVGAIYRNSGAKWASPALVVPKPGSSKMRLTVDLRRPNSMTVPMQSAMPHLESLFQDTQGSTCYAKLDMAHAYWKIGLNKASREIHSIQTPLGVYTPTRILQGGTDSGNHFQAVTHDKFVDAGIIKMIQWIDDFLLYAQDELEMLEMLEKFFVVCETLGLKLHAKETNLFSRSVKFCGRILSQDGMKYDPRHFGALLEMKKPTMGDQLQQLVCASSWMRNSIPNFTRIIEPLHNLLESCYKKSGSRKKRSVRKISIVDLWGTEHDTSFEAIKTQLANATKLAFPKANYRTCLFTDASETHWCGILTQEPNKEQALAVETQNHEPLCFLSGSFTGSSFNWSMPEKEGFAIVESMCKLDYLISGKTVSIFTDHANLVYLYDPYGRNPGIQKHTASKLMRWALKLSGFRYVVEHIPGDKNVWADMLTRWAVQTKDKLQYGAHARIKSIMVAPISPILDNNMDWPKISDITEAQNRSSETVPKGFVKKHGVAKNESNVSWIPSNEKTLQLRIVIAGHTGMAGHRGWKTTLASISSFFYWKEMNNDVKEFVKSCIHCLATQPGTTVPRPMGHAMHASKPNEIIHFDYCYMMSGIDNMLYVLIIKDDFSGFVRLIPTCSADAETTANALLEWFANFGIVHQWISDRGSHFKNQVVRALREGTKSSHHFTLAYCPWTNGTVEVVCRELLKVTRALVSEFQIPKRCWPSVIPIVQHALNNSIVPRLKNKCPLTVFTGLPQDNALRSISIRRGEYTNVKTLTEVRAKQTLKIECLTKAIEDLHKGIKESSDKKRKTAVRIHNAKTNVRPINFDVGDFVLRGSLKKQYGNKVALKWHGPFRVTKVLSNFLFDIENILTKNVETAHGTRLKFFRNKDYSVTEELLNYVSNQGDETFLIEKLDDIQRKNSKVQILVRWKGFGINERDWVGIEILREDAPVMLEEFLAEIDKNGSAKQRRLIQTI